jgi:hypothetical protein
LVTTWYQVNPFLPSRDRGTALEAFIYSGSVTSRPAVKFKIFRNIIWSRQDNAPALSSERFEHSIYGIANWRPGRHWRQEDLKAGGKSGR